MNEVRLFELSADCAEKEEWLSKLAALDARIFPHAPWGKASFLQNAAHDYDTLLLCADGERLLGYALLRCLDAAEVLLIGVDAAARGNGLGKALLLKLLEKAPADTAVFLEVRKSNLPARRLYASCGFSENGLRKGYYKNPAEDAVLMMREALKR